MQSDPPNPISPIPPVKRPSRQLASAEPHYLNARRPQTVEWTPSWHERHRSWRALSIIIGSSPFAYSRTNGAEPTRTVRVVEIGYFPQADLTG